MPIDLIKASWKFIVHEFTEDWGGGYMVMESEGIGFGRLYWLKGNKDVAYIDWLGVEYNYQEQGLGTALQIKREQMATELGFKYIRLFVKKGSWQRKWYARRGYKYYGKDSVSKDNVWLTKKLIVENI